MQGSSLGGLEEWQMGDIRGFWGLFGPEAAQLRLESCHFWGSSITDCSSSELWKSRPRCLPRQAFTGLPVAFRNPRPPRKRGRQICRLASAGRGRGAEQPSLVLCLCPNQGIRMRSQGRPLRRLRRGVGGSREAGRPRPARPAGRQGGGA